MRVRLNALGQLVSEFSEGFNAGPIIGAPPARVRPGLPQTDFKSTVVVEAAKGRLQDICRKLQGVFDDSKKNQASCCFKYTSITPTKTGVSYDDRQICNYLTVVATYTDEPFQPKP